MKRIDFFKKLAGIAGIFWISAGAKPPSEKYLELYRGWIAGYCYYDGPVIDEHFSEGQPILMQREPENKYDKNAIAIFTAGGNKLGFISRYDNTVLAGLMDRGIPLKAEIFEIQNTLNWWERVKIRVKLIG